MQKLTNHFSFEEMTATTKKIENLPSVEQLASLALLCYRVLEPARAILGEPIHVNSGFRSYELNKAIGGVDNSQHLLGEAADIWADNKKLLFKIIMNNCDFDQLIWEEGNIEAPNWIHVSFSRLKVNRRQVLRSVDGLYRNFDLKL